MSLAICSWDEDFLPYTDGLADAEVIMDIQRLNSEIFQLAATISESTTIAVDTHWPTIIRWPCGLNSKEPVLTLLSRALQTAVWEDLGYVLQIVLQTSLLGVVEDWTHNLSPIYQYDLETGYRHLRRECAFRISMFIRRGF